ncbi:HAD family hydrolase [Streptomyces sp. NPDC006529]|uniref:HAD family hydrolase n=1 Tax=Streptomyces sp. NPDC006529 TaxID=3157177 RepID=UPI0033B26DF6
MRCDALSFDLDGTLIDYADSSLRALEAIGGHRSDLPRWYEVSAGVESALDRGLLPVEEFDHDRIRRFHAACHGRRLSASELDGLVAVRRSTVLGAVRLYPDAVRLLRSIEALGVPCIAVSNSYAALRDDIVERLGLSAYFTHVRFCGDGVHRKPAGEAFAEGLALLGDALGTTAVRVVHIGDEFDADVVGALNAGVRGVHVNRSGRTCAHTGVCVPSLDVPLERHADGSFLFDASTPARSARSEP